MNIFQYKDLTEAWERVNEMFITHDPLLIGDGKGATMTNSAFAYDLMLEVEKPILNRKFEYGRYFHYTMGKWSKLLNNYINLDQLDKVKDQIRTLEIDKVKTRYYNVGFNFTDEHGNGKGCLLSGVFSRELNREKPLLTIFIRACEVTSRFAFDLLFFQRLGEYVYGKKVPFELHIFIKQAWADDNILLMYNNHKPISEVTEGLEEVNPKRKDQILGALNKMLNGKEEDYIKYQAHMRTFRTLRPDLYPKSVRTKTLRAKDCIIGNWDGIPLPKVCPNIADRNLIKAQVMKLKDKFNLDLTDFIQIPTKKIPKSEPKKVIKV